MCDDPHPAENSGGLVAPVGHLSAAFATVGAAEQGQDFPAVPGYDLQAAKRIQTGADADVELEQTVNQHQVENAGTDAIDRYAEDLDR